MTSKDAMLALYAFVALQVPEEKMKKWTEALDSIKADLDELENKSISAFLQRCGYEMINAVESAMYSGGLNDPLKRNVAAMKWKKGKTTVTIQMEELE